MINCDYWLSYPASEHTTEVMRRHKIIHISIEFRYADDTILMAESEELKNKTISNILVRELARKN